MAESKIVFVTASVAGKSIVTNHFDKVSDEDTFDP